MNTKNLLFALAISCLPFFAFSETEPNNDPAHANTLGINASDAGTLNNSTDLDDWWKITVPSDGKLIINTTSVSPLDIDLYLYDIDGTTQIASYDTSTGIHEATHYDNLMPGTYYVQAHCWSNSGSYTISSIFVAAGLANDVENNDSFQVAIILPLNGSTTGHLNYYTNGYNDRDDWWKVTVLADGKLVVNTTSGATLDIDLYLYDVDGTTQISTYDTSTGIHEATHYDNLMPGTYFVDVHTWSGYGSYTISSIFTATGLTNDIENNDSFQVASTLPLNGSSTGHLGFYTNGYTDIKDWWKVTVLTTGNLVINTTSDATLDIDLFLYDTDGITQIAGYDTSTGIHEATHYNNISPGTYYIYADRFSGYGSYTISSILNPLTGIKNNFAQSNEISVFPNPACDKITISSQEKINRIEIYNLLGEKVYTLNDPESKTSNEIDLSNFQKGIYYIKVYDGQKTQTKKIVLQ